MKPQIANLRFDTDKKDGTDEQQQDQCRTEGSQSVYIRVISAVKKYMI
jgi:hypothetical protein